MSNSEYPSGVDRGSKELVAEAEIQYGLTFRLWERRDGYRSSILFLATGSVEYVLKVMPGPIPPDYESRAAVPAGLAAAGYPAVAPILRLDGCVSGELLGYGATLYPMAEGEQHDTESHRQITSAGRCLGILHNMDSGRPKLARIGLGEWLNNRGAVSIGIPGSLEVDVRPALLHGDYRAQNILFDGHRVTCVLDWDDAAIGDRLFDLSYGLVFFQSAIRDEAPSLELMRAFLRGYLDETDLTPSERERLPTITELALEKGLALWTTIRDQVPSEPVRARVGGWVTSYSRLLGSLHSRVESLLSE